MTDVENELVIENEKLKKEILFLKEEIDKYERMEVELSTTIDLLREGIIK
jgi:cell division septum initiation protein DivIVA